LVYLAVIIDLFSRRVVGWAISNRMKQDLAVRALNMANAIRRPPPRCIHHTDRPSHGLQANRCRATGSQYCAHDDQKLLGKHGFKVSPLADVNIRCRTADEWERQLLRQFRRRKLFQVTEGGTRLAA
jgi:transposase InsO family protein